MKIGSLILDNSVIMAPMAGVTDLPWRLMARAAGCGLVCSEMVSANGLCHHSARTEKMLESHCAEKPLSVQIFGCVPELMARAAAMVESSGADVVDINFGCAVRKIVKTGSGVALMREPERVKRLLGAVRAAVRIPLTIKIRSGWDVDGLQALEISRIAENSGVDAIAVHPRSAGQAFGGRADWSLIRRVKQSVGIPVIGNGDVKTSADAVRMIAETGCDGVMIGRAAVGNVWIFSQVLSELRGEVPDAVTLADRFDLMGKYAQACANYYGETHACRMLRSRLGWFVKGLPFAGGFRESIKHLESLKEGAERISAYRLSLETRATF